jgi:phosphoribosylformylglycinamidine synthase subunit PurSL
MEYKTIYWPAHLPSVLKKQDGVKAFEVLSFYGLDAQTEKRLHDVFPKAQNVEQNAEFKAAGLCLLARQHHAALLHPKEQSLSSFLNVPAQQLRMESWLLCSDREQAEALRQELEYLWREPAIENLWVGTCDEWLENYKSPLRPQRENDPSNVALSSPEEVGLEFSPAELEAIRNYEKKITRKLSRTEWELVAQTWSEHCKHKIFAAHIHSQDTQNKETAGLFKTHLRKPALEIQKQRPNVYLSLFHDNSGVLGLRDGEEQESPWAFCIKMETHNSPSALSPYGGASTGLVGVQRDILGTGLGAKPIAGWDVLCFEEPDHAKARPSRSLPPDVIRKGVLQGIEDGGNQSGIPTVQGSVVFDSSYAAKPLVFAGCVGTLRREHVDKKAQAGDILFCVGGAVGPDGLRGAVMSSRDLRAEDFSGSAVQVAQPFVQRCLTEFLLEARDRDLISSVTDNGAGGLASSVGEMATSTGGASIDLTNVRTKFEGLYGWERLLSESQERMTVATRRPDEFKALAREWNVEWDELGSLNNSGSLEVTYQSQKLVDLDLHFLHEACPQMQLHTSWTWAQELEALKNLQKTTLQQATDQSSLSFEKAYEVFLSLLASVHLSSREAVVRRFDHEVQGRTRKLPFAGLYQESPQDGSVLEITEEAGAQVFLAIGHGLAPWRHDIHDNVLHSLDEAMRHGLLAGLRMKDAGFLDNFSWPDPLPHPSRPQSERILWKLLRSCEFLSMATRLWQIPFVSGKDSMKNNAEGFDVLETLVITIASASVSSLNIPEGFFTRPNDVVFYLPPLKTSLRGSAYERVLSKFLTQERSLFAATSIDEIQNEAELLLLEMKKRYEQIEALVGRGLIRSAKDIGEGGLLTALFEMTLGRQLGVQCEDENFDTLKWLGEGLSGFVFTCDVHQIHELEKILPEMQRLGVVIRAPLMRFGTQVEWPLVLLRDAYRSKIQEGFWN